MDDLRLREKIEEQRLRAEAASAELRRQTRGWRGVDDPPPAGGKYWTATWLDRGWFYTDLFYRENTGTWVTPYGMERSPHCWMGITPAPLKFRPGAG